MATTDIKIENDKFFETCTLRFFDDGLNPGLIGLLVIHEKRGRENAERERYIIKRSDLDFIQKLFTSK